jgi:hypothetical protein
VTLRGVVHPEIVADLSDNYLPRVEAYSHREVKTARQSKLVGIAAKLILQVQGRVARALRVIFVRDRGTEEGHNPVAGILIYRTFEPVHAISQYLEETV